MERLPAVAILLLAAAGAMACRPLVMTPEARQVSVISDTGAVGGCRLRGEVYALAPFRTEEEPLEQLKIRADGIGADTLVIAPPETTAKKDWKARAYRCRNSEASPERTEASAAPPPSP